MDCLMRLRLEYETTWQECLAQVQQCKVGVPGPRRPVRARGPLLPLLIRPRPSLATGVPKLFPLPGSCPPHGPTYASGVAGMGGRPQGAFPISQTKRCTL